jgi:hypothetical protein
MIVSSDEREATASRGSQPAAWLEGALLGLEWSPGWVTPCTRATIPMPLQQEVLLKVALA